MLFARAEKREEDGRGEPLGVLQDVAVREGQDGPPADAREERVQLVDARGGLGSGPATRGARSDREAGSATSRSESRSTGSWRGGPGKRASSRPRTKVHGRADHPRAAEARGVDVSRSGARGVDREARRRPRRGGPPPPPRGAAARAARRAARRGRRAPRWRRRRGRSRLARRVRTISPQDLASAGSETVPREIGGSAARSRETYDRSASAARSRSSRAASACPDASSRADGVLSRATSASSRGRVARRARDDARAPQQAGGAHAADAVRAARIGAEVRASVGEEALEGGGAEVPCDELEDVADALAGTRVGDGHAVGERAGHAVLRRELVDERPVGRVVVEDDLHLVDMKALVEDAPEDGADLVLLAEGLGEVDDAPLAESVEGVLRERDRRARPRVEESLLEGRELEAGRAEEMRVRREPAASGARGGRPLQDLRGVGGGEAGEDRLVGLRERSELRALSPVVERGGTELGGGDRGRGAARRACGGARGGGRRSCAARRSTTPARGPRRRRSRRPRGAGRATGGACPRRRAPGPRRRARARRRSRASGSGAAARARERVEDLLADREGRDEEDLLVDEDAPRRNPRAPRGACCAPRRLATGGV